MTVNKAQGQSLKKVGLILRTPMFAHGQLYVALSRATTQAGVKVYIPLEKDEEEDIEYRPGMLNAMVGGNRRLEWIIKPFDISDSLSNLGTTPMNIELSLTLLVVNPTATRFGHNSQRLVMCDGLGVIVPVIFNGFDGSLPVLQRGQALKISQANVGEVDAQFNRAVLDHHYKVTVYNDAAVTIFNSVESSLNDAPKKLSFPQLTSGVNKSIGNISIVEIGELQLRHHARGILIRLRVRDSLGNEATIYFKNAEAQYPQHMVIGKCYNLYGLKVSETHKISAAIQFGYAEVGGG